MKKEADKLENHLKNIQNTGQNIGEILKQLDSEKCNSISINYFYAFYFGEIKLFFNNLIQQTRIIKFCKSTNII